LRIEIGRPHGVESNFVLGHIDRISPSAVIFKGLERRMGLPCAGGLRGADGPPRAPWCGWPPGWSAGQPVGSHRAVTGLPRGRRYPPIAFCGNIFLMGIGRARHLDGSHMHRQPKSRQRRQQVNPGVIRPARPAGRPARSSDGCASGDDLAQGAGGLVIGVLAVALMASPGGMTHVA